jgi:hypothetical protein
LNCLDLKKLVKRCWLSAAANNKNKGMEQKSRYIFLVRTKQSTNPS